MLGAPSSALLAGLEAFLAAGLLGAFGYLLALAATRGRLGAVATAALAIPALLVWVLALMLAHIVSGGLVLSEPWLVRGLTLAAAAVAFGVTIWARRRTDNADDPSRHVGVLLAAALAAAAVASLWPLFRLLPVPPTPDAQLHTGWAMQLLNGNATPSATITGDVPNYYPWLFHAFAAFLSHFTPGGHVWHALGTMQVLQVAGVVLGLFAAGRELTRRMTGGLAAAAFGAFAGGIGFVFLRSIDVAPRGRVPGADGVMRYAGDLLVARPYNVTFFNLPPPLPRDVALALMATFVFALFAAYGRKSTGWLIAGGAIAGTIGLTGGESWIVALVLGTVACLVGSAPARLKALACFLGPALAVYSVWFVPTLINYIDLGGFVDTTHQAPVSLPPLGFLGAWGLLTPFALWGFVVAIRDWGNERVRLAVALVGAAVVAVFVSSLIPIVLGDAFQTLETKHRYWPYVHLAVLLVAAVGFGDVASRVGRRNTQVAAVVVAGVVAVGLVSPVVSSLASTRKVLDSPGHLLAHNSLVPDSKSVPAVLLDREARNCVAAVPPELSQSVFAFTGYRLVLWQGGAEGANRARIRWRNIYDRIAPDAVRLKANEVLTTGGDRPEFRRWVRRFGVDLVVTPTDPEGRPPVTGYPSRSARFGPEGDYVVLEVGDC